MKSKDNQWIPIPTGMNIYTFNNKIINAHHEYQNQQKLLNSIIKIELPILKYIEIPPSNAKNIRKILILPKHNFSGRPLLLFEPHSDDAALSVWGSLCAWQRPVVIVTVFGKSNNLHPQLRKIRNLDSKSITKLRKEEAEASLKFIKGTNHYLELEEEPWPHSCPNFKKVNSLVNQLQLFVEMYPEAEIMAPLCISRHPDHMLVRHAAEKLGCKLFWEDVDFYPNYAQTIIDREYYKNLFHDDFSKEYQPISNVLLQKMAALACYQSQYFPFEEMWSVFLYNWAVAQEGIREKVLPVNSVYAERTWRKQS